MPPKLRSVAPTANDVFADKTRARGGIRPRPDMHPVLEAHGTFGNRAVGGALLGGFGDKIVTVPEIEATIRSVLKRRGSYPQIGHAKAAFNANPRDAKASLAHTHFRDDMERIAYAIGYFESFLGIDGPVSEADLVNALVGYEIQAQSKTADAVVQSPPTEADERKLAELRERRQAQAAAYEAEQARKEAEYWSNQMGALAEQTAELPKDMRTLARKLVLSWRRLRKEGKDNKQAEHAVLEEVAAVYEQVLHAADKAIQAECRVNPPGRLMKFHGDPCEPLFGGPRQRGQRDLHQFMMRLSIKKDEDGVPYRSVVYWLQELRTSSEMVPATMAGAHLRVLQSKALLSQALSLGGMVGRGVPRAMPPRGAPRVTPPAPAPVAATGTPKSLAPTVPTVPAAPVPKPTLTAPTAPAAPVPKPTPTAPAAPPAAPVPKPTPTAPAAPPAPAAPKPAPSILSRSKKFLRDRFLAAAIRGAEASDAVPGIGAGGPGVSPRPPAAVVQPSTTRPPAPTPNVRTPAPTPSRPSSTPTPDTPAAPAARPQVSPAARPEAAPAVKPEASPGVATTSPQPTPATATPSSTSPAVAPQAVGPVSPAPVRQSRRSAVRDEAEKKLAAVQVERTTNQAKIEELESQLHDAENLVERHSKTVRAAERGSHARAAAVKEFNEARTALNQLREADELGGYLAERPKLRQKEEAILESLGLKRPTLWAATKAKIRAAAKMKGDKYLDANTGEVIEGTPAFGHIYGREHRRLVLEATEMGMNQEQFDKWVNDHPDWFQLETKANNESHRFEKPGID